MRDERVLDPQEACVYTRYSRNKSVGICFGGLSEYFSAFLSFYRIPESPSGRKMWGWGETGPKITSYGKRILK